MDIILNMLSPTTFLGLFTHSYFIIQMGRL